MTRQILSIFKPTVALAIIILLYSALCVRNEQNAMIAWEILIYKEKSEVR